MTYTTDSTQLPESNRRVRGLVTAAGFAAAIAVVAVVGSDNASSGTPQATSRTNDPTGLGAALAVTYDVVPEVLPDVLPPGVDDDSQLGYPEAACATDVRTWILGI